MDSQKLHSLISVQPNNSPQKKIPKTKIIQKQPIDKQKKILNRASNKCHQPRCISDTEETLSLASIQKIQQNNTIEIQMAQKEKNISETKNLMDKQKFIFSQKRKPILQWLRQTVFQFSLTRYTFTLASYYIQQYFFNKNGYQYLTKTQLNSLLAACLLIASKIQQIVHLKVAILASSMKITPESIFEKQLEILKTLKFNLRKRTYTYDVDQCMAEWDNYQNNKQLTLRKEDPSSYQRFRAIYNKVDEIHIQTGINNIKQTLQQVFLKVLGDNLEVRTFLGCDVNKFENKAAETIKQFRYLKTSFICRNFYEYLALQTSC